MARSVRLRLAVAKELMNFAKYATGYEVGLFIQLRRAIDAVDRASTKARPKRKPRSSPELLRAYKTLLPEALASKKAEKRERRADIRRACWRRSGGRCECGYGYSRQARYAEDRLVFVEARAALPAAPRLTNG